MFERGRTRTRQGAQMGPRFQGPGPDYRAPQGSTGLHGVPQGSAGPQGTLGKHVFSLSFNYFKIFEVFFGFLVKY